MSEVPTDPTPVQRRSASPALTLRVLGIVVMVLFVVVGVLRLASRSGEASPMGLAELAEFGLFVLLGIVCGGLLTGISSMLKALRGLHASMVRVEQMEMKRSSESAGDSDSRITMASSAPVRRVRNRSPHRLRPSRLRTDTGSSSSRCWTIFATACC